MNIPSIVMKQTKEGEGFPGVGDSICEYQRVPALENLFHQVPHSALEEFSLRCLWTIHLKRLINTYCTTTHRKRGTLVGLFSITTFLNFS